MRTDSLTKTLRTSSAGKIMSDLVEASVEFERNLTCGEQVKGPSRAGRAFRGETGPGANARRPRTYSSGGSVGEYRELSQEANLRKTGNFKYFLDNGLGDLPQNVSILRQTTAVQS